METDRKPLFSPLVRTFHSAAFYREAARERSGRYTGYLLFLVVLLWIPRAGALYASLHRYVEAGGEELARQVPKVRIEKGTAATDPPGRREIRNPGDNVLLMVIDTSPEAAGAPPAAAAPAGKRGEEPVFRLLRDRFEVSLPGGAEKVFPLAGVDGFYADEAAFREAARTFPADFTLLFTPLAMILSFAARFAETRLLSVAARGFAAREGADLDADALVRLAVFSVTPAAVARLVLDVAGVAVPFAFALDVLASLAFVRFAVRSAALPVPPLSPSAPPDGDDDE